jgi:[ribosomal protein S5]-alanine N-acetyltransferase
MEIETKRLLLRPLRDDDAVAMAQALNNYEVSKNLARVKFPYSVEDAIGFINLQRGFGPPASVRAIAFKCAPDELIGLVSYDDNFDFGYWLSECCWHQGIMSEAARALVADAFTQPEIQMLYSCYHIDNPNSGRILLKLGFVETQQEMNFSLAQGKFVEVMKMRLKRLPPLL